MKPLALLIEGEGPQAVVLIHGVGGGRQIWGPSGSKTTTALAQAGFKALAVDLPGYGESQSMSPLTISNMADAVLHTLKHLNINAAVWVGHSMGGMVAQDAVSRHPAAVNALVLACTSPAFGRPDGDWQQAFVRDRLALLDQGQGMQAVAERLVPGMVSAQSPLSAVDDARRIMAAVPEATYRQAVSALVGFDGREHLQHIQVPTLCLAGEHDPTSPPEVLRRMSQRIPGSLYECLPEAGHIANLEQPQAFNQALVNFLSQYATFGH